MIVTSLSDFPRILENLENNNFTFQVLEMSLNFTKSGNVLEQKGLPVKKRRTKNTKYFACRRKLQLLEEREYQS